MLSAFGGFSLAHVLAPAAASQAAGLGLLLAGGWTAAVAGAARLVALLAPQLPASQAAAAAKAGPRRLVPVCVAWLLLAAATSPFGIWPELRL
eukprot:s1275_g1.t1